MLVGQTPADAFAALVKRLAVALRPHGFRRRGQTFHRRRDGNWGLVNFQKSMTSTATMVRFTINLGIFSERIGSRLRAPSGGPPSEIVCHWRQRIGWLLPQHQDLWWAIDSSTSLDALGDEVEDLVINKAVSVIDQYITDEALRDLWLSGQSPGETDLMRLRYLLVLLKAIGPEAHIEPTLDALRRYGE